jgi:hypothetical protein
VSRPRETDAARLPEWREGAWASTRSIRPGGRSRSTPTSASAVPWTVKNRRGDPANVPLESGPSVRTTARPPTATLRGLHRRDRARPERTRDDRQSGSRAQPFTHPPRPAPREPANARARAECGAYLRSWPLSRHVGARTSCFQTTAYPRSSTARGDRLESEAESRAMRSRDNSRLWRIDAIKR